MKLNRVQVLRHNIGTENMDLITSFMSNPIVGFIGYLLSFVAAIIAIVQYSARSEAEDEVRSLRIEITNLQANTKNENTVRQGEKSQYFQENNGPVNIDNRG
ncbi:hypothetical protein CWE24_11995 [Pseudidiomarina donghaiensis]|uniref:Uncharacterized protein n=2 Tax=Pseudidiomarina donghaiensis TaxID=519452 RepID=A0A432XC26_9GAMM|nr:hypothetical protein CWE24_11995 [Pseudidiomarina donghaiensis]